MNQRNAADVKVVAELRVLYGAQAGAALPLMEGRYLVGSGDECDITLRGPDVAARHADIELHADGFSVYPRLGASIGLSVRADEGSVLAFGDVFHVGEIRLTLVPPAAPWAGDTQAASPREQTVHAMGAAPGEKKLTFRRAIWVGSTAFVALIAFVGVLALSRHVSGAAVAVSSTPLEHVALHVQRVIDHHGLTSRIHVAHDAGQLAVTGYVPTARKLHELVAGLNPWRDRLTVAVYADDDLLSKARAVLTQAGLTLTPALDRAGRLTLSGVACCKRQIEALTADLTRNVTGLRAVGADYMSRDLIESLINGLKPDGAGNLELTRGADGGFELTGRLTASRLRQLEQVLEAQAATEKKVIALAVRNMDEGRGGMRVKVRAVVKGDVPYVILDSGERVFVGGRVGESVLKSLDDRVPVFGPVNG